jgi:alkylation response protein AidB-like acyl-CoA dehydrogenase
VVEIEFRDVPAAAADLICDPRHAPHLLDRAYDAGRLHLAAEMLGAAQEAFDRAVEYLKTRVQFGKKIGEFQALQHRAAILFGELEIARSTVLKAAATGSAEHISMAKARVGEIAKHVAGEAVQFHGGIGVTDDFDLGFFLKRIRAASEQLGDSAFHTERYAALQGL